MIFACCVVFGQYRKASSASSQYPTDDTLYWNKNRMLTWNDFQAMPDSTSIGGAATYSGFITKSRYTSDTSVSIIISAVFYKKESWQKTQYQTVRSLKHEQGHFDITEVYARKATIAFKAYKLNRNTVSADVNRVFNSFVSQKDSVQYLYDKETDNHRNLKQQKIWDKMIASWLKKYPEQVKK